MAAAACSYHESTKGRKHEIGIQNTKVKDQSLCGRRAGLSLNPRIFRAFALSCFRDCFVNACGNQIAARNGTAGPRRGARELSQRKSMPTSRREPPMVKQPSGECYPFAVNRAAD